MTKLYTIYHDKDGKEPNEDEAGSRRAYIIGILLSLMVLAPVVEAGCSCSAGNWDPSSFLKIEVGGETAQPVSTPNSADGNSQGSPQEPLDRSDSFPNSQILKPMKSVSSSDVVVDVSNGNSYYTSHIKNSIHIPTREFLDETGNLLEIESLAKIFGDAGVSREDSLVLYGTSQGSGEAEFAFLVLSYLGQKDVKLLDGDLDDWQTAGLPVEVTENKKTVLKYTPEVKSAILADYEYVKSGQPQIVDVRPFVDFGMGRIPGSVALDPTNLITRDRIKDGDDLSLVFSRLTKDKPIVVYSSDYSRSSLVWYALQLMGYEASIYAWEDWKMHETQDSQEAPAESEESAASSRYTKLGRK
ncbi:MAG: putative thiosulfate sulfurtransferase [Methanosaeta sp. PtaU1.Bin112]|nr:MAG: putative thiosulfate sulfurtransferase [Methanosaeta sp. PtaU1.Bin112]